MVNRSARENALFAAIRFRNELKGATFQLLEFKPKV